jgi:hypothetical protein
LPFDLHGKGRKRAGEAAADLAKGVRFVSAPVFISYSSKDRDIAETICQALESRGQNCWISCRDVHPGENFQEAIVKALRSARVMLLVFTSNANNSDEIKKELVLAGKYRVTVMPVRVEDVVPNDAFSYEFATRQWFDLFKDWEREIELLASRVGHVLKTEKPPAEIGAEAPTSIPQWRAKPKSSNRPLLLGGALVAVLIVAGGAVLYMKPFGKTPASTPPPAAPMASQAPIPPQQTAAQTPPPAPAAPPQAPAVAPPPAVPISPPQIAAQPPPKSPDEMAWDTASGAGTRAAFDAYLKDYSAGLHADEARMQVAQLLLATAAPSKDFDGTWQTTWFCPFPADPNRSYQYDFKGLVKNGAYHGVKGVAGQPGSMVLDGKIEPDGAAAFRGVIIVNSSFVALGAAKGSESDFFALAQFERAGGKGKRLAGRTCTLTFMKQ